MADSRLLKAKNYEFSTTFSINSTSFDVATRHYTLDKSTAAPHRPLGSDDVSDGCKTNEQRHGTSSPYPNTTNAYPCDRSTDFRY